MRKLAIGCALALLITANFPNQAGADLVSASDPVFGAGSLTIDTDTNLAWLDLTFTDGKSFDDVSSQFGAGGDFEGFRYATENEVLTFFEHAGIPNVPGTSSENFDPISALYTLVGTTDTDLALGLTATPANVAGNQVTVFAQLSGINGVIESSLASHGGVNFASGSWLVKPAGTVVNVDQFVVMKNGTVFLNDPFSDSQPPPQSEATTSYFTRGDFGAGCPPDLCADVGGKTTMNSDNGLPTISNTVLSTGRTIFAGDLTRNHRATFTSNRNNSNLVAGLKIDDDIEVLGLFDLVEPNRGSTNYGIGFSDFGPGGVISGRNDRLRLSVLKGTSDLQTRISFFRFERGAGPGGADLVTPIARSGVLTPADLSNSQILLRLRTPANDNTVTAEFAFVNSPIDISDATAVNALSFTTFPNTATIFDGENFTLAEFRLLQRVTDFALAELTSGSPTSISQTVDTGATPFDLSFNFRFETTTGELTVTLDGTVLGAIMAPGTLTRAFQNAKFLVDGSLLNQTGLELKFEIDGPAGSTVVLDNILFPGISNGNFATGDFTDWTVMTTGTGSAGVLVIENVEEGDLEITEVEIEGDEFEVEGSLTLGAGSDGIDLLNESVTLKVGTFSTTIPAGSFELDDDGTFEFEGVIGGVELEVEITPISGSSFDFESEGEGANLTGTINPVEIILIIGDDTGTASVNAEFDD